MDPSLMYKSVATLDADADELQTFSPAARSAVAASKHPTNRTVDLTTLTNSTRSQTSRRKGHKSKSPQTVPTQPTVSRKGKKVKKRRAINQDTTTTNTSLVSATGEMTATQLSTINDHDGDPLCRIRAPKRAKHLNKKSPDYEILQRRAIKEMIINNNIERGEEKFVHQNDSSEEELIAVHSEEDFDNWSDEAISPIDKSPTISSTRIANLALEMAVGDNNMENVLHVPLALSVLISIQQYLELPVRAARVGGYYFLIPFAVCTIFVAWPLFHLELFLGQYTSVPSGKAFPNMMPILKGMAALISFTRLSRVLFIRADPKSMCFLNDYIIALYHGDRDWTCFERGKYCTLNAVENPHTWCITANGVCNTPVDWNNYKEQAIVVYGRNITEQPPVRNLRGMFNINVYEPSFVYLVVVLAGITLSLSKMTLDRFSKFSVFLLLVMLSASLLMLKVIADHHEWNFSLPNDPSVLLFADTWLRALHSALGFLSLCDGTVVTLGSHMPFHYNSYRVTFTAILTSVCLCVLSFVFVVPMTHAYRSRNFEVERHKRHFFLESVLDILAVEYNPTKENIVVYFIFAMWLSQFSYLVVTLKSFQNHFNPFLKTAVKNVNRRLVNHCYSLAILLVCGYLIIKIAPIEHFEHYLGTWDQVMRRSALPAIAFGEVMAVSYIYGVKRFLVNMKTMFQKNRYFMGTYRLLKFHWSIATPIICGSMIFLGIVQSSDELTLLIQTVFQAIIIILPVCLMISAWFHGEQTVHSFFISQRKWGPLNVRHREQAIHDERAARICA